MNGYIEITRTAEGYEFARVDADGERWELGTATERVQDEDTPDEMRWFAGYFDTAPISFEDEAECVRLISKRKPHDDVRMS